MDKSAIRKEYRELRKAISNEKREEYSERISNRVLDFLISNPVIRHIHIFLPIPKLHEVNTFPLLEKLQDLGYILYTSYINPESKVMETLEITYTKQFKPDTFGIPIPNDLKKVDSRQIQMVLIPLLAFDRNGNRIGYGKAYYDQFLAALSNEIIKVGLSFFNPIPEIPVEAHDIRLDFCITPDKKYLFNHF
jgi:5-formyltetrahydrofolate cyclo-ligase